MSRREEMIARLSKAQKARRERRLAFLQRAAKRRGMDLSVMRTCQHEHSQHVEEVRTVGGATVFKSSRCRGCHGLCELAASVWLVSPNNNIQVGDITDAVSA